MSSNTSYIEAGVKTLKREQLSGNGEWTKGTWREQTKEAKNTCWKEKRKTLERTKSKNVRCFFYIYNVEE